MLTVLEGLFFEDVSESTGGVGSADDQPHNRAENKGGNSAGNHDSACFLCSVFSFFPKCQSIAQDVLLPCLSSEMDDN